MKLNYTTNFQFRTLNSIATPTLPLQASPTMYWGSICFCINISYPLTHRTAIYVDVLSTIQCINIVYKAEKHRETFCVWILLGYLYLKSDVLYFLYVCEHARCVYNISKSTLLFSNQALVWAADLDSVCQPAAAICQNQLFSLCWTPLGLTCGWRSLQD